MRYSFFTILLFALLAHNTESRAADPLTFSVTITGNHDIEWDYSFTTDTTAGGGYRERIAQSGTEFVDYKTKKAVTMVFKQNRRKELVGRISGRGIGKFPELKADITNGNAVDYTCSGLCPPPPDVSIYKSGCASNKDAANIKLTYDSGTFVISSLTFADLGSLSPGTPVPLGFNPSSYLLPIGVLAPLNCGPVFPPNNPAQDLVDYRYPFLPSANSNILPGKSAKDVDKKLKQIKVGKTLTIKFNTTVLPQKTYIIDGSGYDYDASMGVFWTVKIKRIS